MKKLLVILLAVAMLFGVTAYSQKPVAAEVDNVTGKTVYFVNAGPDDYYAQFGDAFKAIGAAVGLTVKELNSDYNPEQELANVQDAISAGADAVAVITAGSAGSAASIAAANAAGVPIFFIAGKPELIEGTDLTGHVTDNFVMMGYMLGKWVAENYPDAKCVNIPGFLGQGTAEGEIVGFDMALTEAGMQPAVLTKSSEWQRTLAIPIAQDLIASGQEFDVVFCCNEETYFGVKQVFEELGITGKVLVSNNGKDDAWPDTLPRFQEQASDETKKACQADQIREFRWSPAFAEQNWSLFLLPVWSSFYLDDDNKPQSILVNGQSGQMSGARRASMKHAKKVSMYILIAAIIIFALTVGLGLLSLWVEEIMTLAIFGLVISVLVGLAAIYPIATVWSINRQPK